MRRKYEAEEDGLKIDDTMYYRRSAECTPVVTSGEYQRHPADWTPATSGSAFEGHIPVRLFDRDTVRCFVFLLFVYCNINVPV